MTEWPGAGPGRPGQTRLRPEHHAVGGRRRPVRRRPEASVLSSVRHSVRTDACPRRPVKEATAPLPPPHAPARLSSTGPRSHLRTDPQSFHRILLSQRSCLHTNAQHPKTLTPRSGGAPKGRLALSRCPEGADGTGSESGGHGAPGRPAPASRVGYGKGRKAPSEADVPWPGADGGRHPSATPTQRLQATVRIISGSEAPRGAVGCRAAALPTRVPPAPHLRPFGDTYVSVAALERAATRREAAHEDPTVWPSPSTLQHGQDAAVNAP